MYHDKNKLLIRQIIKVLYVIPDFKTTVNFFVIEDRFFVTEDEDEDEGWCVVFSLTITNKSVSLTKRLSLLHKQLQEMKAQSYCKQTTYSIPTSSYPFYAEKPILTLNSPKGNNGTAIPFAIFNMFVEKTRQFN